MPYASIFGSCVIIEAGQGTFEENNPLSIKKPKTRAKHGYGNGRP